MRKAINTDAKKVSTKQPVPTPSTPIKCKVITFPIDPKYLTHDSMIATIAAGVEAVKGELYCTAIECEEGPCAVVVFGESGDPDDYTSCGKPMSSFKSPTIVSEIEVVDGVVPEIPDKPSRGSAYLSKSEIAKLAVGTEDGVAFLLHTWDALNLPGQQITHTIVLFEVNAAVAKLPEGAAEETFLYSMLGSDVLAAHLERDERTLYLLVDGDQTDVPKIMESAFTHFPWDLIGEPHSKVDFSPVYNNDPEIETTTYLFGSVEVSLSNAKNFDALRELQGQKALSQVVFKTYLEEGSVEKVREFLAGSSAAPVAEPVQQAAGGGVVLIENPVPVTANMRTLRFNYSDLRNPSSEIAEAVADVEGVVKLVDYPALGCLELVLLASAEVPSPLDYSECFESNGDATGEGHVE